MFSWFVAGMRSGMGYPSGIFTRAGTGVGEVFYRCMGTGNLAGKILSHGYEYGIYPLSSLRPQLLRKSAFTP
jgi:uncharacterized membrane protein YedE/YeeE